MTQTRIAKAERLVMALRNVETGYLWSLDKFGGLVAELTLLFNQGDNVDEVLKAIADLVEEALDEEA